MRALSTPIFALVLAALISIPTFGQDTNRNRSARIIEEEPEPPVTVPAPAAPMPLPPPEATSPANNSAGVAVEVLPRQEINVGTKITFRVTTQKPGYLVLVDVDATGKLTQIYPNTLFLSSLQAPIETSNLIKPGRPVTVPDPNAPATFEFVASPPLGVGMVVAILSDKPLQMVDLPDVPIALAGQRSAGEFIRETTHTLRILPSDDSGRIVQPKWSVATTFYAIR